MAFLSRFRIPASPRRGRHWPPLGILAAAIAVAASFPARAIEPFGRAEVDQSRYIAVAQPRGQDYQLLLLEQVSDARPCWQEFGQAPVRVDPLLANFDFTGICGRRISSNGYSIRLGDRELALTYNLRLERRAGEVVLVGYSFSNPHAPVLEIGSTQGYADGFLKIFLYPGWRFARRTYNGQILGHVYFTRDDLPAEANPATRPVVPWR